MYCITESPWLHRIRKPESPLNDLILFLMHCCPSRDHLSGRAGNMYPITEHAKHGWIPLSKLGLFIKDTRYFGLERAKSHIAFLRTRTTETRSTGNKLTTPDAHKGAWFGFPFFTAALKDKAVPRDIFAIALGENNSTLLLGDIALSNIAALCPGYLQIGGAACIVGQTVMNSGFQTVIDTGTSLMIGPPKEVEFFYDNVEGALLFYSGNVLAKYFVRFQK